MQVKSDFFAKIISGISGNTNEDCEKKKSQS